MWVGHRQRAGGGCKKSVVGGRWCVGGCVGGGRGAIVGGQTRSRTKQQQHSSSRARMRQQRSSERRAAAALLRLLHVQLGQLACHPVGRAARGGPQRRGCTQQQGWEGEECESRARGRAGRAARGGASRSQSRPPGRFLKSGPRVDCSPRALAGRLSNQPAANEGCGGVSGGGQGRLDHRSLLHASHTRPPSRPPCAKAHADPPPPPSRAPEGSSKNSIHRFSRVSPCCCCGGGACCCAGGARAGAAAACPHPSAAEAGARGGASHACCCCCCSCCCMAGFGRTRITRVATSLMAERGAPVWRSVQRSTFRRPWRGGSGGWGGGGGGGRV